MKRTIWPCGSSPFRSQYSRKRRRTSASTRMLNCTLSPFVFGPIVLTSAHPQGRGAISTFGSIL